jgi:hypothetical protein
MIDMFEGLKEQGKERDPQSVAGHQRGCSMKRVKTLLLDYCDGSFF